MAIRRRFSPVRRPAFLAALCALGAGSGACRAGEAPSRPKPPLTGLVAMGNIGFHRQDGGVARNSLADVRRVPGVFSGIVVNATWEQLEPERGRLQTGEIDRFLEEIRTYNRENRERPLGARLRVWPGPNAPAWAKNLGGAPVTVLHKGMPITVGRYWDKPYRTAWRELQNRLAARYDPEPVIREVSNTSGSSITDEPFIVAGDAVSLNNLRTAGFGDRQFQETLAESWEDYAAWATTVVEWAVSPYRAMDTGKARPQPGFTLQMMRQWREKMGSRGSLGNHALNEPVPEHLAFIYDEIRRLGPPSGVQTHSPEGLDWDGAIRRAAECRIQSVELWSGTKNGGFERQEAQALRRWSDLLR